MHDLAVRHGYTPHIRARGEEIKLKARNPGWRARRWVVEARHSWLNRNRGILIRLGHARRSVVGRRGGRLSGAPHAMGRRPRVGRCELRVSDAERLKGAPREDLLLREQEATGCDLRWLCTEVGRDVWFEEPVFDCVAELPATVADIRPPRRAHARFPTRAVRRLPATPQPPAQGAAPSSGDRLRMRVAVPLGACGRAYPGVVIRG